MRIYLDSAPIIYLVEKSPVYFPLVATKLAGLRGDLVSSELGRMESLVLPFRNADAAMIQDFEDFFAFQIAEIVGFDRSIFSHAARIRADYRFKTPDALHLAAAIESGCDIFLTNDYRLKQFTGIRVEVI